MNTAFARVLCSALLGLTGVLALPAGAHTAVTAALPWNQAPDRSRCPDDASYAWVRHAEGEDCIRYFAGGELRRAPLAIVQFSGDRDASSRLPPEEIRNNTRRAREAIAARQAKRAGVPVIFVARPGTYGSSGNHNERRRAREYLAMNAALDTIRQRYAVQRFIVVGHSGGATIAGALLTLGRTDIECAVLTSGAFDLVERLRRRASARGRPAPADATLRRRAYVDPLHHVGGIAPDPQRRIYVIGNPRDSVTPFDLQRKFAQAIAEAGHHVELIEAPAHPPGYHNLKGGIGFRMATACAVNPSSPHTYSPPAANTPGRYEPAP